jgi:hypothetical protein
VVSAKLSKAVKNLITCFVYRMPFCFCFSRLENLSKIGNDVVPSLSIGLIRDFRNVTYNLWREPGIAESVMSKILGISRAKDTPMHSEAEELWCWALLKTLRADMDAEKLYPPGRVYWINARTEYMTVSQSSAATKPVPTSSGEMMSMHLVEDVECAFSEFTFSSSMFTDHAPNNYEYAMQMLVAAAVGPHLDDENQSGTSTPGTTTPPS